MLNIPSLCSCIRAVAKMCVCACMHACVHACMRACAHVCITLYNIILPTNDQTRNAASTDSPNNSPVGVSDVPVTLPDTSDVPTVSAQTLSPFTTLNANFFDSQASSSTTRLTTTEVVYTQGQIKFTFTTPTSTLTPHSDCTKIMQMADIYESQNQIQKTMFENIALNRLLKNNHTMWNAITYVKGKIQHTQQILRPQYIPFQPSRFAGPYYSSY